MSSSSMNLKSLLDALAFANVDNLGDFRALLNQSRQPVHAASAETAVDAATTERGTSALAPAMGHIQGAH